MLLQTQREDETVIHESVTVILDFISNITTKYKSTLKKLAEWQVPQKSSKKSNSKQRLCLYNL